MPKKSLGLLIGAVLLIAAAPAGAAPVTVNLRIEGPTSTLYESPVTTDLIPFHFTSGADTLDHTCDGQAPFGTSSSPVPTRGSAIAAAPLVTTGSFGGFGPSFDSINGVSVAFDAGSGKFLAEYKNGQFASVGACGDPIANGDDVLFAYADGSEQLLKLSGPIAAAKGQPVTLHVTDAGSGAPVSGAAVAGSTSASNGDVVVGPLPDGVNSFKATKTGTIRSNTAKVCVNTGSTGLCGTVDKLPPTSVIAIKNGKRYKKKGPRSLKGTVSDTAGIAKFQLRLTARPSTRSKRCTTFDAKKVKFVKQSRCGAKRGSAFTVDVKGGQWSYLLPKAPGKGRYVLDAIATDTSGNKTLERVTFYVK